MKISNITWRGDSIDDVELLKELPSELVAVLADTNGFVLHSGALHVRGATHSPDWHSLRKALQGDHALHRLYDSVRVSDIPFAQDQVGDQFILRDGSIHRLAAETGEIVSFCSGFAEFLAGVENDIEQFLNVGLQHKLEPGQLLHAYPPFCFASPNGNSLRALSATEVILVHADLARQIRDLPDGAQVVLKVID